MKQLLIGLVPLLIFAFLESQFGSFWGLIGAIVWSAVEIPYEYFKTKTVSKLTLLSTGLVVVLGGLDLIQGESMLFKFQPVIVEVILAGFVVWDARKENSFLLAMAKQSRPEVFDNQDPRVEAHQKIMLAKMSKLMAICLILHAASLAYVALHYSTGQWIFWKTFGLFPILFVVGGIFFLRRYF